MGNRNFLLIRINKVIMLVAMRVCTSLCRLKVNELTTRFYTVNNQQPTANRSSFYFFHFLPYFISWYFFCFSFLKAFQFVHRKQSGPVSLGAIFIISSGSI